MNNKDQMKENLNKLRDAYSELLLVFHNTKHYTIEKHIHNAIFEINRSIKCLEDAIDET